MKDCLQQRLVDLSLLAILVFISTLFVSHFEKSFALIFTAYLALCVPFLGIWFTQKRTSVLIPTKEKPHPATHLTLLVGVFEGFLLICLLRFFTPMANPTAYLFPPLAFWMTFKAATQWRSWTDPDSGRIRQHLFVIGQVLNFGLAVGAFLLVTQVFTSQANWVEKTMPQGLLVLTATVLVVISYYCRLREDS